MAEMDLDESLQAIGIEEFAALFQEHGLSAELLPYLSVDNLKEIVPSLGKRLFIKKKIETYFKSKNACFDEPAPALAIPEINENIKITPITEKSELLTLDCSENILVLSPSSSSGFCPSTSYTSTPLLEINKPKTLKTGIESIELKVLLEESAIGKALLQWYQIKGGFDTTRQSYLVDIITTEILKHSTQLKNEEFDILTNKIVELFPCETKEAYYLPPIRKKDSRDKKPGVARGKLVDKFRNRLTFLREAGILPSRGSNTEKENQAPSENADDSVKTSLLWLEHNREPLEQVYKHWDATFNYRQQQTLKEERDGKEYFTLYPVLKLSSLCFSLIERDFVKIYPNAQDLFSIWDSMIVNLIKLRRNYVTIDSDKILIDLLESQNLSKDYKHYVMLTLLGSLLPYKSRHVFGSKQWKPKIADCKEGIVLKVELAGDVEAAVNTKTEKLQSVEVPLQPFIIVVGSGAAIQQIYVYIFGSNYNADCQSIGLICMQLGTLPGPGLPIGICSGSCTCYAPFKT